MKLAFSTLACPAWTVEQAADAAAANGYEGIEWRLADGTLLAPDTPTQVLDRIAEASRTRGLDVVCLDTSCTLVHVTEQARDRTVGAGIAMADLAARAGAPVMRVFGGRLPEGASHDDVLKEAAAALRQVVDHAAVLDVRVAVETHDDWASSAEAVRLARVAGAEVLWDVHHPYRVGEEPAETVDRLAGCIALVHVKDACLDGGGWRLTGIGDGDLPLQQMLELLDESGYDGYVSLEWEKLWHPELPDPDEVLPRAAGLLRGLVA